MTQATQAYDFSIVIPALNEEAYLPLLLKDLANQSFHQQFFEVIVVDGNSTDKTIAITKTFADKLNLRVVSVKKGNVAAQRNRGIALTRAPWVICMDADNRIPSYFLDGIKYQLAKNVHVDCFTCWIDENAYRSADKPLITMFNLTVEVYARLKPGAPGAMIGVRRNLGKQFPFNHTVAMSEDHEFIESLVRAGKIFSVFRSPKYTYSLRRLESEGTLKMARTYAKAQLYLLMGKQLKHGSVDYAMGGEFHQNGAATKTMFSEIRSIFSELVKNQRQTARKVLEIINSI